MKRSDLNHLRRLVAWVRCEIGQDPAEMQKTMIDVADKLGHPEVSDEGKARLVEGYRRAAAVPQYVRDAIKVLDRYARPPGQDGGQEKRRADGETRADAGSDGGPGLAGAPVMLERLQAPGRVSKGGAQRPTSEVEKINMADSHAPMCNDGGGCAAPFCPCANGQSMKPIGFVSPSVIEEFQRNASAPDVELYIGQIPLANRVPRNGLAAVPVFAGSAPAAQKPTSVNPEFLRSVISLCTHHGASPDAVEGFDPEDKWIADLWRQTEAMLAVSNPASDRAAIETIQRAVNAIERPEGLTDTRWEYVKAGIRLLVAEVNRVASGSALKEVDHE